MLAEPQRTQFDLHFSIFGFSVRVHPFFWALALLLGIRLEDPKAVFIWIAVVFVSILVHELGHALAFRYYGIQSHIVLYHFGGLAVPDGTFGSFQSPRQLNPKQQIVVSAAGPAAGFLLAGLAVAMIYAVGESVKFQVGLPNLIHWELSQGMKTRWYFSLLVTLLLSVNIFWGLLNLIPLYPLDGGQISREIFLLNNPRTGIVQSLWLSVFSGGAVAVWGITRGMVFMGIMFGMLAYSSYQMLQQYRGGGGGFGGGFGSGGRFGGGDGSGGRSPW